MTTFVDLPGPGRLYLGDCIEAMRLVPDGVVDMVLCDLPYGTTSCTWDSVIPFEPLWEQWWRVCKPDAAVVLTAAFPFTGALWASQPKKFRYAMIWDKVNRYTGALQANQRPLRRHEDVLVFGKAKTYNKQMREGKPYNVKRTGGHGLHHGDADREKVREGVNDGQHNPCSVIEIKADEGVKKRGHPTQKPVPLFEYLVRTYTDPDQLVLDCCMGSGTTAIACLNAGRRWVGVEQDEGYHAKAVERIRTHVVPDAK